MKGFLQFLRTTVVGGLVFLVPIVVVTVIVAQALQLAKALWEPMARFVPIDTIAGFAVANLVAGAGILALCFLAGLAARSSLASGLVQRSEARFLLRVPGYRFVKGMVESISGEMTEASMRPVLMKLDDSSQIVFEVERLEDGRVVAFVPGSPDPWSGSILVLEADRIEPLPINLMAAVQTIQLAGQGTRAFLGTAAPPAQKM